MGRPPNRPKRSPSPQGEVLRKYLPQESGLTRPTYSRVVWPVSGLAATTLVIIQEETSCLVVRGTLERLSFIFTNTISYSAGRDVAATCVNGFCLGTCICSQPGPWRPLPDLAYGSSFDSTWEFCISLWKQILSIARHVRTNIDAWQTGRK